jgi:TonB-dependent starch-binding outer membrane protein SusC
MKNVTYRIFYTEKKVVISLFTLLLSTVLISTQIHAARIFPPIQISGSVTEQNTGEPVIGVNVYIEGTTTGTLTDIEGEYTIEVPSKESVIVFSYIGYKTQKIRVGEQTEINVQLVAKDIQLDETVVVGYGTQKKKLVTGATVQVSGEDIQRVNTTSTLRALQSQSPGLSIISTSGRPDSDFKINIRGLGTIGNAKPLVVINGIAGGDLRNISPADIESVDILKDAASAAIYGARAANGVILITTKQGKEGKPVISYDTYYGVQNPQNYMEMVTANEYIMLVNESLANSDRKEIDFSEKIPASDWERLQQGWEGTDWLKELTNVNAPVTSHSINISGGTELSTYSVGTSYLYQEAILGYPIKEKFERYSVRLNSKHVLFKNHQRDIVTFGENLLYTYKKNRNRTKPAWRWTSATPLLPLRDSTGNYTRDDYVKFHNPVNPVAYQYYNSSNEDKLHDIRLNAYLEIKPVENLTLRSNFGYSLISSSDRSFIPVYDIGSSNYARNLVDETTQSLSLGMSYQIENTLTYEFSLDDKHNFKTLVGQSIERIDLGENISGMNTNSLFNDFEYAYLVNNPNVISGSTELTGGPIGESALASFFGRINYDYLETYLLTAIVRRDGSSNFAPGERWGVFPSVSAGWVVSNENFFAPLKSWLEFFKLRISWGQNGNQDILPFQYVSPFNFSGEDYYFGTDKSVPTVGAYPAIIANEFVTWETSQQLDYGFDCRLFNGSLQLAFDIYDKETKDWLVDAPNLAIHGAESAYMNGGTVTNKGFEISLEWKSKIGKLSYGVTGSFGHNKNKITRIDNLQGLIEGNEINEYANSQLPPYRAEVGYPIGYFWGYETDGIFQTQEEVDAYEGAKANGQDTKPGDVIFVDKNNDGVIDTEDRGMIGDPNPKAIFGISAYLDYAGFDLSVTASGVAGNSIMTSYHSGSIYIDNYPKYLLDRWHGEGTSNRYPRLTSKANANYTHFSDIYLNKGDYLRIQNLTIGYDFRHLLNNTHFGKLRIYVAAQNLYTFTNYIGANPEVGADMGVDRRATPDEWAKGIDVYFNPIPRTYTVGANVSF